MPYFIFCLQTSFARLTVYICRIIHVTANTEYLTSYDLINLVL